MWTPDQQRRLAVEERLLWKELNQFRMYNHSGETYIAGFQRTNGGFERYELKLQLTPHYPFEMPCLYVTCPRLLFKHGHSGTVNDEGVSHAFHTRSNGPGGCVQICHFNQWNSSFTCVAVLLKGICWLQAYENHRRTGDDLAAFMC